MTVGYQGGDGEFALVEAYQKLAEIEEDDVITKIKSVTWVMGSIIEIAKARGYHLDLGFKGWCFARLGKSSVHANECLKAWELRHNFDRALEWYQEGNTTWMPSKPTGPRFAIELDKVYRDRLKSEHERLQEATRKKEAAERREQAKAAKQAKAEARWRHRFERLRREHLQWAAETQRESRVLVQIDAETREEEKPGFSPDDTGTSEPDPGDRTEPVPDNEPDNVVPFAPVHAAPTDPSEPEPAKPERYTRQEVLQEIAKVLKGRIYNALIDGTADKLHINSHNDNKDVFVICDWSPHPDITTKFALELAKQREAKEWSDRQQANGIKLDKGHIVVSETNQLRRTTKIQEPSPWPVTVGQEAKARLIAACKAATDRVMIGVDDGKLSFSDSQFCYDRGNLEWVLKKDWTRLSLADRNHGVIKIIVPGKFGDFLIYLRGVEPSWGDRERAARAKQATSAPESEQMAPEPTPQPSDQDGTMDAPLPTDMKDWHTNQPGFAGKPGPDDHELAELRGYAIPDPAPTETVLDWMDDSLPPVGERTMDHNKPPVGFPGKPGKYDQELAELRQYALHVIKDAGLPLGELVDAPKKFWLQHRDAETVREIWLQRALAADRD